MLSIVVSRDIVNYLLMQKGYSRRDLALALDVTVEKIRAICHKKAGLEKKELETLLKLTDMKFWELADKAIPSHHLPQKIKDKITLCKKMSEMLKRRKKG